MSINRNWGSFNKQLHNIFFVILWFIIYQYKLGMIKPLWRKTRIFVNMKKFRGTAIMSDATHNTKSAQFFCIGSIKNRYIVFILLIIFHFFIHRPILYWWIIHAIVEYPFLSAEIAEYLLLWYNELSYYSV